MPRTTIILTLAAGLICIGAAGVLVRPTRPTPAPAAHINNTPSPPTKATGHAHHSAQVPEDFFDMMQAYGLSASGPAMQRTAASSGPSSTDQDAPELDPDAKLPLARLALWYVGSDPVADDVWEAAINDPSLDPEDRKDLIEDLNEDGFPDPEHVTQSDLPLIESRLALIDTLAPSAMDDTNAEAFKEARKDLVEMRARLVPSAPTSTPSAPPQPAASPTQPPAHP